MRFMINQLVKDWAWQVNDGMPDPKNRDHLEVLEQTLRDHKYSEEFIYEYISQIKEISFKDKEEYQKYAAKHKMRKTTKVNIGGQETTAGEADKKSKPKKDTDDKEASKKDSEEPKVAKSREDKEKTSAEIKSKLRDDNVNASLDVKNRIQNLEAQAEWELDGKEELKAKENLQHIRENIKDEAGEGSISKRTGMLVALQWLSPKRKNSGYGKNMQTQSQRDSVIKEPGKTRLLDVYGDGSPEHIKKSVMQIRKRKVSEEEVESSFNGLPPDLQDKLGGKGKVGDKNKNNHFRGYKAVGTDGKEYVTSDRNDPNIKKGEDGNPEIDRGTIPNKNRAKIIWRIYLEQGGMDAYSGEPLQLQDMDLEHLVGFNNSDNGPPTLEDALNRENDNNFVLCASSMNQTKKDMSMDDYIESVEKNEGDRDDDYYERMDKTYGEANDLKPGTEQRALAAMDEVTYSIKGGGSITKKEFDTLPEDKKPKLTTTDDGTPKTKSATLGPNMDQKAIQLMFEQDEQTYTEVKQPLLESEEVEEDDKKDIKKINSKIGKKTIQAMGLAGGAKDPSGRRTSAMSANDDFYKGYGYAMAGVPYEDRAEFKKAWDEAVAHISTDEVRGVKEEPNPNYDPKKKESAKNPKTILKSVLNYPPGHKKAGKNRGKANQTKEFRKFIRNAKYPEGHSKAGQPLFDINNLPPEYQKHWRYEEDGKKI